MPIGHASLNVTDLDKSLRFYLEALGPLGYKVYEKFPGVVGLASSYPDFWITSKVIADTKREGTPTQQHIAFDVGSRATVRRFHEAALKAGATCNGPPGLRPQYADGYYAAFVLDPDGHNLEVMCFSPWWIYPLKAAPYIGAAGAAGLAFWAGKSGWL